ncbi:MAG: discoidin domain-containing protein [Acidimicrobiales bacterium]
MHRRLTRALVFVVVAGAALLVPACSNDSARTSSVSVRSFDEVRASPIVFEADPLDPSRAIFRVTTTEAMICAIVWGTDTSFGRFNNSLSMNGTGIVRHDVSLPDVERGVTYTYVLEGMTANGTLYRSAVGTFRIGEAGAPSAPTTVNVLGKNIATSAKVTAASSEFSPAFAAANAIDGKVSTDWATRGDGNKGSITIDLGSVVDITGAEFVTRSMADGTAITSSYTVSVDSAPPVGPFPAATLANPRPAAFTARGQSIRFDIAESTGGNVGAVEIRVFG